MFFYKKILLNHVLPEKKDATKVSSQHYKNCNSRQHQKLTTNLTVLRLRLDPSVFWTQTKVQETRQHFAVLIIYIGTHFLTTETYCLIGMRRRQQQQQNSSLFKVFDTYKVMISSFSQDFPFLPLFSYKDCFQCFVICPGVIH